MVAEATPAARDPAPHDAPAMLETIELNGEDSAPSARARSAKIDRKMASKDLENGDAKSLNGPDDAAEQAPRHAASDERTFVNAIIAFLGSGILGLPYAFRKTGIVVSRGLGCPAYLGKH
jgi:solute carrier family 36 (proton-coupled amino acid transporter)